MQDDRTNAMTSEFTLDPDDWDAFSTLSHRMVDEMLVHLRTLRDRPAWVQSANSIQSLILDEPLPMIPQGEEAVYGEFVENVLPYRNGNLDPRFYGWVQGNGFPYGMMADMLAAGMNPHLGGFNQNPALVEVKVVEWLREIMGLPLGASGLLLSGGSMANLTGLTVARNSMAGFDIREEGLQGTSHPRLTVYGSSETHSWAKKAVEILGLGNQSFRRITTNPDFTIDVEHLRRSIDEDRKLGHRPMAVLATAGTVNNGATDDLCALADLCAAEQIWLHVDGAFGALAAVSQKLRSIVSGLERADSVAFDLHKWMYMPFEVACLLVRDGEAHRAAFSQQASYIASTDRGVNAGGLRFADLGIELTRGFKALKVWMSLKAYGLPRFAGLIEQNVEHAQYLAELIRLEPSLELMAPVPMNIVCFRFRQEGLPLDSLNSINEELLLRVQESGLGVPSSTVIGRAFCLRACIVNHRTRRADLDSLVQAAASIGREILDL